MATIKDVAKLAGVSTSTVSRALSRKVRVEKATREKVLEAVARLDYRPNSLARGLRDGFTRTLAMVIPELTNPFFPKLVHCVEKRVDEQGYSLILCDSGGNPAREKRHVETLRSDRVDGALFTGINDSDCAGRIAMLRDGGIPTVLVNRSFDLGVDCVTNDNRRGAREIITRLIRMGHRRIACLVMAPESQHYRQRVEGCRQAFAENGIDDYEQYLVPDVRGIDDAYRATRRLLERRERPTAFFAFVDIIAFGIYSGIYDSGLSIPDDVSVAGFDDIATSQHMFPPLTTYAHPVERIAGRAVERLMRRIRRRAGSEPARIEIRGRVIVRPSIRRIRECKG